MHVSILVAMAVNGVIGRGGMLPWRLSADLQRFKQITMGHTIIMGRRTWESIARPLPGRRSVVISRQPDYRTGFEDVAVVPSLDAALETAAFAGDDEAFIIGGAEIYRLAMRRADRIYLTRVMANVEGDTYFPVDEIDRYKWRTIRSETFEADTKNDYSQTFEILERI